MGSADIRYRPEYPEWSAVLTVEFNSGVVSLIRFTSLSRLLVMGAELVRCGPKKRSSIMVVSN